MIPSVKSFCQAISQTSFTLDQPESEVGIFPSRARFVLTLFNLGHDRHALQKARAHDGRRSAGSGRPKRCSNGLTARRCLLGITIYITYVGASVALSRRTLANPRCSRSHLYTSYLTCICSMTLNSSLSLNYTPQTLDVNKYNYTLFV